MTLIRRQAMIFFFLSIAVIQKLMGMSYAGYLIVYLPLILRFLMVSNPNRSKKIFFSNAYKYVALFVIAIFISILNSNEFKDVFRDIGAFFSFFLGVYIIGAYIANITQLLFVLSFVGIFVALATILGATLAFVAGADAYFWRGEYVPFSHGWLPYSLVVNVTLLKIFPKDLKKFGLRAGVCVVATIVSLSRTDILLDLIFISFLLITHWRRFVSSYRNLWLIISIVVLLIIISPYFLALDVVQERLSNGVDDDDPSLGWRFIENASLLEHILNGNLFSQLFGFGLGARLPLPAGILDFDGNSSIPHLHNSFLTILLKFGLFGLLSLIIFLIKKIQIWFYLRKTANSNYAWCGLWIIFFVICKGITLQGLSEWSHLIFFGIGCMFLKKNTYLKCNRVSKK